MLPTKGVGCNHLISEFWDIRVPCPKEEAETPTHLQNTSVFGYRLSDIVFRLSTILLGGVFLLLPRFPSMEASWSMLPCLHCLLVTLHRGKIGACPASLMSFISISHGWERVVTFAVNRERGRESGSIFIVLKCSCCSGKPRKRKLKSIACSKAQRGGFVYMCALCADPPVSPPRSYCPGPAFRSMDWLVVSMIWLMFSLCAGVISSSTIWWFVRQ